MTFRYIGSKARLVDQLQQHIGVYPLNGGRFVDAFCGTGAVAKVASELGWPVWVNDHLISSGMIAAARLMSKHDVLFTALGGYELAVECLNQLKPLKGFIWREYSPASFDFIGQERRYFTEENASRIDAIRNQIESWQADHIITAMEAVLLKADLLSAVNRVANIAGTYGCFLSKWTTQAANKLNLSTRTLCDSTRDVKVTSLDVAAIQVNPQDLVYLDPPYTKRQYASYYHLMETIALGDEPIVEGVCGLRPWREKASDFCYKRRALAALSSLVENLAAKQILLSYSSEGHIAIDELQTNLSEFAQVKTIPLSDVGRYRPNQKASDAGSNVCEYLIVIDKRLEKVEKNVFMYEEAVA